MGLTPRLDLRQSQSLVMTPQLQQAIKLLALTNLEVEAFIDEELERNPLLEVATEERDDGTDPREDIPDFEPTDTSDDSDEFEDDTPPAADQLIDKGDGDPDASLDVDYEAETFHHDTPLDTNQRLDGGLGLNNENRHSGGSDNGNIFEELLTGTTTLADHLAAQVASAFSGTDALIAGHIIDHIDEAGYFTGDLVDMSQRLEMPVARLEQILSQIQQFDPSGIGARNLAECLAIQAREADRYDPAMARLIDNLDLLARGDFTALRRICGVDQDDLIDMIGELRAYNPKPGLLHGNDRPQTVIPDVFVTKTKNGWSVELNSATLPRILINRNYFIELAHDRKTGKQDKAFLRDCLQSANWLVKALDQRARTIIRVASALVQLQEGFFEHGVSQLKPLTLRAIADEIGMHESTVSRVTSNKYLSCTRGLFEMKYFFSSAIQMAEGGEAVSALAVKGEIKALIAAEDPKDILSDDKLVDLLRAKGFDIARRTVAKYREALGIGSSVQRRRAKLLHIT